MVYTAISTRKTIVGLTAAAVASTTLVASALGSAPTANATCASFFGLGNGGDCTSSFGGIAIAIGTGATATAMGFLSTAVAIGTDAQSLEYGALNLSVAVGTNGGAEAGSTTGADVGNIAISFGDDTAAVSGFGVGNIALNFGNGNTVAALGSLNTAYAIFSTKTKVTAQPGPLATAGSFFQTLATVTKKGPGININGISIGGAAAPAKTAHATPKTTAKAATATKGITRSAAAHKHTSTK
jgi:hypothetical protein